MTEQITKIDNNPELQVQILPLCRLKYGEIWIDPLGKHKIGCLDIGKKEDITKIMNGEKADLSIQDPPYNVVVGNSNTKNLGKIELQEFIDWCRIWVKNYLSKTIYV